MTTATIDDISRWTEGDRFFLFFAETAKSAKQVAAWLFLPFFFPPVVILAQFFPSRVLRIVTALNARLPEVTDEEQLSFVRDALKLTYGAACFYGRFCMFRSTVHDALLELSETIDSLELVLHNQHDLDQFVKDSEAQRTPELPFMAARRAVI